MRILTWNVNVLRTVLDYHPFSSMSKKNVEGLLDTLEADIFCFQEHKTRRELLDKATACPGRYDGFWTFPRHKSGYSGVCTYVNSDYCVPLKAEEGITGILLGSKGGTMKPPWTPDEQIGCYPELDDVHLLEETDGVSFDPARLDVEGRAVVCDFGLFVLFNLYVPNRGSEARGPYKLNFLTVLKARVEALMAAGREVILAGDMNVIRQPIDFGEGTVVPGTHYLDHPDRHLFESWCHPKGPLIDVVRESFPDREGMYTCWNTKIDARPANYGSRIDYILCTPGLRKWIKGGDIQAKVFGSDHCPVFIDLHDEIEEDGQTIRLKDVLNPADRPRSTAPKFPSDVPRTAPEPPRFATKFFDEFSGKQQTLKSLWANAKPKAMSSKPKVEPASAPSPSTTPTPDTPDPTLPAEEGPASSTLGIARAAFSSLDSPAPPATPAVRAQTAATAATTSSSHKRPAAIDLTRDEEPRKRSTVERSKSATVKKTSNGQTKLASFFSQPGTKAKMGAPVQVADRRSLERSPASTIATADGDIPDTDRDALIAIAMAEEDEEREKQRTAQKQKNAPAWSEIFAKKVPPKCNVHGRPCKDFIVKQGSNKGKRFWLCSLPVGPGYDMGRSKRPREQVNPEYRCDYFLWDSLNTNKEKPK